MFTLCFTLLFIKGLFCLKITTPSEINITLESNSSISLNCKYETETNEKILNIQWNKKTSDGNYKNLVYAVKNDAYYDAPGSYLKNRSELHGFGNGSTSVILIIKDIRCIDNGQYQCSVEYIDGSGLKITQTNTTVVYIQADAKKPTVFSVTPNSSIEEHGMVKLSCVGDVGNPPGSLAIWRVINNSNTGQLLENTSVVNPDAENCIHIVHHTTYNLTRDDNGAEFSCSSQNQYTTDPGPATEIGPIQVLLRRNQRLKTLQNTEEVDMGGYLSPVGESSAPHYVSLGQETVHMYSTMQDRDLVNHRSNYEALGQGSVHVYSTMQDKDLYDPRSNYEALGQGSVHVYSTMQNKD